MGVFDKLIKIESNGNVSYAGWIEWNHVSNGVTHCPICLVLDKCWFDNTIKPKLPQHDNCHCTAEPISKPIPNVNAKADCDIRKFTDYIFSDKYAWNGKRDLFEILGFTKSDSEYLKKEYEKQAVKNYCDSQYRLGKLDIQGQRINIKIRFDKNGRKIVFDSGWMVRPKGEILNNTPLAN